MARNIKQVSHDLIPIIGAICDIGQNVNILTQELSKTLQLNANEREYFETLISAIESLNASSRLAQDYILEVDAEADQLGIKKSY